jgi:hypothetical protein
MREMTKRRDFKLEKHGRKYKHQCRWEIGCVGVDWIYVAQDRKQ